MVFVTDVPILAPMMIGIALPTDTWQQLLGQETVEKKDGSSHSPVRHPPGRPRWRCSLAADHRALSMPSTLKASLHGDSNDASLGKQRGQKITSKVASKKTAPGQSLGCRPSNLRTEKGRLDTEASIFAKATATLS